LVGGDFGRRLRQKQRQKQRQKVEEEEEEGFCDFHMPKDRDGHGKGASLLVALTVACLSAAQNTCSCSKSEQASFAMR
jgi:hypothetical protein